MKSAIVSGRDISGNVSQAAQIILEVNESISQSSTAAGEIASDISSVSSVTGKLKVEGETLSQNAEQLKFQIRNHRFFSVSMISNRPPWRFVIIPTSVTPKRRWLLISKTALSTRVFSPRVPLI